jgi:hypothetical protein
MSTCIMSGKLDAKMSLTSLGVRSAIASRRENDIHAPPVRLYEDTLDLAKLNASFK